MARQDPLQIDLEADLKTTAAAALTGGDVMTKEAGLSTTIEKEKEKDDAERLVETENCFFGVNALRNFEEDIGEAGSRETKKAPNKRKREEERVIEEEEEDVYTCAGVEAMLLKTPETRGDGDIGQGITMINEASNLLTKTICQLLGSIKNHEAEILRLKEAGESLKATSQVANARKQEALSDMALYQRKRDETIDRLKEQITKEAAWLKERDQLLKEKDDWVKEKAEIHASLMESEHWQGKFIDAENKNATANATFQACLNKSFLSGRVTCSRLAQLPQNHIVWDASTIVWPVPDGEIPSLPEN